jgi:NADPH:quinone reductase
MSIISLLGSLTRFNTIYLKFSNMRALKFFQTGSLDNLRIEEVPMPVPATGEVLVQVKAAAINPSDIKNVQGKMHETTVPRVPGRDFAGVVVKGPDELLGQPVYGSGGNLGFGRDGSHAEYVVVPVTAIVPLPRKLSFEQAAGIGVAYITAWAALINVAQLRAGETALILGTTGAVGSAAARIAHELGARVIGTTRKASDVPLTGILPVDDWVDFQSTDLASGTRKLTNGRGADVVLDVVGGTMLERCLAALAWRGRQVAISSSPEPRVCSGWIRSNSALKKPPTFFANSLPGSNPAPFLRRAWKPFRWKKGLGYTVTSPSPKSKPNPS